MQETIDGYATDAWDEYTPPKEHKEILDTLTDQQYFLCGNMFTEGFKAGFAFRLTTNTGETK